MKYLAFISLLFTLSCSRMPEHCRQGYAAIHSHNEYMKKTKGWLGASIGGSYSEEDIKMLTTSFQIISEETQFNVELARQQMVLGVKLFLSSINQNSSLIKHLNHHPFTHEDLDYGLSYYTKEGEWLGHSFLVNGNLVFFETDENRQLQEIHREVFSEALEKVEGGVVRSAPRVVAQP